MPIFDREKRLLRRSLAGVSLLHTASTVWAIFYDSIYALQDLVDDLKAAVESSAVKHEDHAKIFLSCLACD